MRQLAPCIAPHRRRRGRSGAPRPLICWDAEPPMPLHLVHGPPNSGRAGVDPRALSRRARPRPGAGRSPTLDDVFAFERELCARRGALCSAARCSSSRGSSARSRGRPASRRRQPLTAAQRIRLLRAAIGEVELGPLRRSAARPGLRRGAGRADRRPAGGAASAPSRSPAAPRRSRAPPTSTTSPRSTAAYASLRDSRGHADSHTIARAAIAALRRDPDSWGGRPVLLYGFDDLTVEQLRAGRRARRRRPRSPSRSPTRTARRSPTAPACSQQLSELGPDSETATEADPANTDSPLLFHLERGFLRDDRARDRARRQPRPCCAAPATAARRS